MFSKEPIQAACRRCTASRLAPNGPVFRFPLAGGNWNRPKGEVACRRSADSLALSRSVPLTKALDDAMVALYQNGERLMPGTAIRCGCSSRLGRQHERQIPAPVEVVEARHELLRDPHLFTDPAGRKGVPVLLPAGVKSFITTRRRGWR